MLFDLKIEKMIYGGAALGRHNGLVVFVDGAAPQDMIRVYEVEKDKKFWRACKYEILEPSPLRQSPPCPVFNECGGCQWQHIDYKEQLRQKQKIVEEALRKSIQPSTVIHPLLHGDEWRYRNRIQLHKIGSQIGFKKKSLKIL